jgi:ParB-like chromosome segregation protein Spo0J
MKIEQLATGDLIPYVNNSRTHDDKQVGQIAASIKEFGFTNPILIDNDNGIIAGHGRLQGAQKLGIEQVPCIRLGDLTEAQKKAYVIADNKLALNAGWDMDLLAVEIEGLQALDFDVDLLGFDADELVMPTFDPVGEDEQGKLDQLDPKWIDCPHCGKEFDMRENS